jgi:hypothetical protein
MERLEENMLLYCPCESMFGKSLATKSDRRLRFQLTAAATMAPPDVGLNKVCGKRRGVLRRRTMSSRSLSPPFLRSSPTRIGEQFLWMLAFDIEKL